MVRRRETDDAAALLPLASCAPSPEQAAIQGQLCAAAAAVIGTLCPADVETLLALARGERPAGATFRKRVERALSRLREAWRERHGTE